MSTPVPKRGTVYRCPVCGAEIGVIGVCAAGCEFAPRCCNVAMESVDDRYLVFYVCPVCGAEAAVMSPGTGTFAPRCCNVTMVRAQA